MNVKKIIISIGVFLAGVLGVIFGRGVNRSGIQPDNGSVKRIGKGIDAARKSNKRIKERVDVIEKGIDDLDKHNKSATNRIRTARDILEKAKTRTDNEDG